MASLLLVEERSKDGSLNSSSADEQQAPAPAPADESTPGGDQLTPKKRGRKRKAEETEGQGEEDEKKVASSLVRPSRERKSVERYAALSPIRVSATKALAIQQGSGETLKDIPNVAFKMSKRKADDSLRLLHKILFGRKANVHFLKRNILQFSGFVWSQNEEKDRLKVKEKLNKCNKDRLLDLSDLLDIYTLKVNTKKEDISARLMEFLESPHVTREVILSEKAKKGKKRKRGVKRSGERALDEASADKEKKRERRRPREPSKDDKEEKDKVDSIERDDESVDEDESDDAEEASENSKSEAEDGENEHNPEITKKSSDEEEMDEHEELESKQYAPAARKVSPATSRKGSSSSKQKVYKESKSKVSSESKTGISKDTKRSSNLSKTSKKGLSSSKKADAGEPKVDSERKESISKDAMENSNKRATSKKGLSSSKKKVDTEGEPKVSSNSKAESSKDTKGSSKIKDKVPIKTDSKDNSKRKVSKQADISKEVDKRKGKSDVGTASKDITESKKVGSNMESNNAEEGKKENLSVVPTTEELSAVVSEILKEVDFNVATLADIIRKLGARFDTDLMDRKAEIKRILEEVINNMTDDEDAEDGDDEGEKN